MVNYSLVVTIFTIWLIFHFGMVDTRKTLLFTAICSTLVSLSLILRNCMVLYSRSSYYLHYH